MFEIHWSEPSTKRNAVWVVAFLVGLPMVFLGKDVSQLLLLAGGVAGAMGMTMRDKPHDLPKE
jgi:hypothetical protein